MYDHGDVRSPPALKKSCSGPDEGAVRAGGRKPEIPYVGMMRPAASSVASGGGVLVSRTAVGLPDDAKAYLRTSGCSN